MCYVYNSGEPGWYESGERETTSVVSGHARAAVETVVDVPDHGDAGERETRARSLSRQGGNDNDNPIRKINNKRDNVLTHNG